MKRILSVFLCSLLLLGLLPMAAQPAQMLTAQVSLNRRTACVGDVIWWTVSGADGSGIYAYSYALYRNDRVYLYDYGWHPGEYRRSFTPTETGTYYMKVWLLDIDTNTTIIFNSLNVVVTARSAPGGLRVQAANGTALKVSWNKVAGATGYEVWMSTVSNSGFKLAKATTALTFSKTYLKAGVRYFFKVRPYNLIGGKKYFGTFSPIVSGVPMAKAVITDAVAGVGSVKLTWNAVPGATGYQVYSSATPGGTYKALKSTTARTINLTGLKSNTAYYFKVAACKRFYTTNYYGPLSGYKGVRTN